MIIFTKKRRRYIFISIFSSICSARHETNANYGNLMSDKVEKRVAKDLLCDSCWSSSWVKNKKSFLALLGDQQESHNKSFATHFSTLSYIKFP